MQGRHSIVKNRQRWKNNQVRQRRTKAQCAYQGEKKSKVTLTQSPREERRSQGKDKEICERVPSLVALSLYLLMFLSNRLFLKQYLMKNSNIQNDNTIANISINLICL